MGLPSGYTRLEYLTSTGTQYLKTGIIPTNGTKVKIKFRWNSIAENAWMTVFGSRTSSSSQDQFNITTDTDNSYAGFASQELTLTKPFNTVGTIYEVVIDKNGVTVNGESAGVYNSGLNVVSNYEMYIFGRNNSGTFGNGFTGDILSMEIWVDDILVRDYVPAKNQNSILGFLDLANNTFSTNAGTGTFTAGPVAGPVGHRALIDATDYEITQGTVMIDGVEYKITAGKAIVDGTISDIKFPDNKIQILLSGNWYFGSANYVMINGITYNTNASFPFSVYVDPGSIVRCCSTSTFAGVFFEDGTGYKANPYYEFAVYNDTEICLNVGYDPEFYVYTLEHLDRREDCTVTFTGSIMGVYCRLYPNGSDQNDYDTMVVPPNTRFHFTTGNYAPELGTHIYYNGVEVAGTSTYQGYMFRIKTDTTINFTTKSYTGYVYITEN